MTLSQRFARFVTDAVLRRPALWRLFRGTMRRQFDSIAPSWDSRRSPTALAAFGLALDAVSPPARALDVGTGTGAAALVVAERFPDAEVVGVDLSPAMLEHARRKVPAGMEQRVRFEQADSERLPFEDGAFQLVTLANMIPFFDEVARVLAPGGAAIFAFSSGDQTPIYVPAERLKEELGRRDFAEFADFSSGPSTALLARKR